MFDDMEQVNEQSTSKAIFDELEAYLNEPRVRGVDNVLKWWYDHSDRYPVLSRLARDYLSIPRMYYISYSINSRLIVFSSNNCFCRETI